RGCFDWDSDSSQFMVVRILVSSL
ncbi:hypothetical protein A2U01_0058313, partial [Trifolium medium]|nr:hypothetical protein [Trifolium medium]